jgi:broad specificity phosphatase PhoE
MNPTRVLLLRHAETAVPEVFHGAESDIGLSVRGMMQALAIAPRLAAQRPCVVVSSAMKRAVATAGTIVREANVPHRLEPALHERAVGELCGVQFESANGLWTQTMHRWMAGETDYAPPGSESYDDIRRRALPVWERLRQDYAGRTYVVIAHGVVIKVLATCIGAGLTPADWNRFRSHNLGLHELLHDGTGWRYVRMGEVLEEVRQVE